MSIFIDEIKNGAFKVEQFYDHNVQEVESEKVKKSYKKVDFA